MSYWLWAILRLLPILLLASIMWLAFDLRAALIFLIGGLAFGYAYQLARFARFRDWIKLSDLKRLAAEMSDTRGIWGDVFASLYYLRRDEVLAKQNLAASLDQFRQSAEVIPDGIVLMDKFLRIDWNNIAARRYLAISHERDQGLSILDLVRNPRFADYAYGRAWAEPVVIRTNTEPVRSLSILLRPFGDDQHILICHDVTASERADIMRRDFVANVSHELKTPLTVILGFLEGLIESASATPPDGALRQYMLMQEQASRMNRLVSDLLVLSSLEETSLPEKQERVDVPVMLEALIDEAKALSHGRHAISAELSWTTCLHGNREELHSAFSNLISNAVRYTPDGGRIVVRWQLIEKQPTFEVIDTGIGVAQEHLSRLTERFYRVDSGRSSATGGTGLGLAIVKHVLLRHQAKLEIESRLGEGSTFRVVFGPERAA